MSAIPFKAGGALTDEHAAIYVERRADRDALTYLRAMDYLLVIEPRQQGKTSLINHLMCHPALGGVAFAYVDVTTPDRSKESTWYQTLCPRILRQLRSFIPRDQWPAIPQNSAGWRDFLWDVAALATDAHQCVVIAMDEIGAVTFPGATQFFSVLRDVYNSRQAETELKRLTFLLAGAFHPRDLIEDEKISPFNIAQRVRLNDFTLVQVQELVSKGPWMDGQATMLAERVHYWTDGQPYLAQLLCSYLGPEAAPADVDSGVDRVRREDENHLPPMLDRLERDEKLFQYVERIAFGERIKFYPREHQRQAQLELLGIIKADEEGCCTIRNRIYEQSLIGSECPSEPGTYLGHTVEVGLIRSEWADKRPKFKEVVFRGKRLTGVKIDEGNSAAFYDLYLLPSGKYLVYAEYATWDDATSDLHGPLSVEELQSEFPELATRAGLIPKTTLSDEGKVKQAIEPITFPAPLTPSERQFAPISELNEALRRRTLALFLGADLSHAVTGLPSRADLARDLAHRKGLDVSLSLAKVAQRVARGGNRWDFTAFIRDALDTTGKSPQPFHRRIVELVKQHQIETLITTAYDNLLELAFQKAGIGINRVVRGSDVGFINPDRPTLIKLYGDAQQPDTLVVTEDDHYGLWRDREKEDLLREVRTVLRRQTVLFLGYNLADPDFNLLWREVLDRAGRFARTAYAVWPGLPEGEARMWRDRGVVILDADPWGIAGSTDTFSAHGSPSIPERLVDWYNHAIENKVWQQRMPGKQFIVKETKSSFEKKLELFVTLVNHVGLDGDYDSDYTPLLMPRLGWHVLRRRRSESERHRLSRAPEEQREWEYITNVEEADSISLTIDPFRGLSLELTEKEQGLWVTINPEGDRDSDTVFENGSWVHKGWRHIRVDPQGHAVLSAWLEDLSQGGIDHKSAQPIDISAKPKKIYHGTGNRWAVLVGINEYEDPYIADLKVCVDDVTAVYQSLDPGYQVAKLLIDATPDRLPTRANVLGELSAVSQAADEGDLLLFYFSGHGLAWGGESYLLSRDTRLSALKHTAVAMRDVRELMDQSPAWAKVIVLDACHSGASIGKAEPTMTPEFIRRVFEEAEGMAVLASCKQGQQSWEWTEKGRSVFTYYLLEALAGQADLDQKGFVTVSDASRHVTDGVKSWATQEGVPQTPTLQYTVAGDIVLVRY